MFKIIFLFGMISKEDKKGSSVFREEPLFIEV